MPALIPISTFFIGCHGLLALGLSYRVAIERTRQRIWHGATAAEVAAQPDYLKDPNAWAAFVEKLTQQTVARKTADDGVLQRTIRAQGNFIEYVPLGLLLLLALEWEKAPAAFLWLLGAMLILARIAHAWGVIQTYGPSPGRAIGFFGTWLVYLMGSIACLYYSLLNRLN
ncbi:MAPEG family protein [Leptolyngbya sp. AN03gr2]|uniref:MAPEG family protein n=1 Tax=unclassified Leptolyngbya TaxID=2650499 RepID=UPI003D31EC48